MPRRSTALLTCICVSLACAATTGTRTVVVADAAPVIDSIAPASGPSGAAYPVQVTLSGRNFADSTNTVAFGGVTVQRIPSTKNGTRIELFLPKEIPSRGEVPPQPLPPGEYILTVTTAGGTSNPVKFIFTNAPFDP